MNIVAEHFDGSQDTVIDGCSAVDVYVRMSVKLQLLYVYILYA